jgi:transposase
MTRDPWWEHAQCHIEQWPLQAFYPEDQHGKAADNDPDLAVMALCARCPVQAECLDDALTWENSGGNLPRAGFVGGKTPQQRTLITASRRGTTRQPAGPRPARRHYPQHVRDDALQLYRGGTTPREISRILNIPESTVYDWHRAPPANGGGSTSTLPTADQLVRMVNDSSLRTVAERLRVSPDVIRRRMNRAGWHAKATVGNRYVYELTGRP